MECIGELAKSLNAALVRIAEEVPDGLSDVFQPGDHDQMIVVIHLAFRAKRRLWRAEFGLDEVPITSSEAVRRFIIRSST